VAGQASQRAGQLVAVALRNLRQRFTLNSMPNVGAISWTDARF
jgi:hypothetical protein